MPLLRHVGASVALLALLWLGPVASDLAVADEKSIEGHVARLASEHEQTRSDARRAIDAIGPKAVPALLRAIDKAEDPSPFLDELFTWRMAPFAGRGVPILTRLLEAKGDSAVAQSSRFCAILALGRVGPAAWSAGPALRRALTQAPDPPHRLLVAILLLRQGESLHRVMPTLRWFSTYDGPFSHSDLAEALGMVAHEAPRAVRLLANLAAREGQGVVEQVCAQLADLGPKAAPAHDRLASLLSSEDRIARLHAAAALLRLGAHTEQAHAVLLTAARSRSFNDRKELGDALRMGLAGDSVEAFVPVLDAVRIDALHCFKTWWGLARAGAAAAPAVPTLRRWLRHEAGLWSGLEVLAHLGRKAEPAREDFELCLKLEQPELRVAAAACLLGLDPDDVEAAKELATSWKAVEYKRWRSLNRVLGATAAESAAVVPLLVEMMEHLKHDVRTRAALGIGRAPLNVDLSLDVLFEGLSDAYPTVREACAFAIAMRRPDGPKNAEERQRIAKETANTMTTVGLWMHIVLARGPKGAKPSETVIRQLEAASKIRPRWRSPDSLDVTWEPRLDVALAEASRAILKLRVNR